MAAALAVLGFAASCGKLLGDYDVEVPALRPDGGGAPIVCTLGATRCDGRLLQLCTDEGTAWATLEACATPDLCRASDTETVSACIPPACSAEQMSCDQNQLRLCNAARTGWELFATCETAAHCDAGRRQCLPAPCEPGARRCNVGNLERCNDDRTDWELLDTCVTNDLCEATLRPAAVVGEVLTTSDLTLPAPASDAEGPTECRGPVCVPREVRCQVNRLNACNEGQTDLLLAEECASQSLCEASITYTGLRGSPRCVRPLCAPGEHRCTDVGVLEVCNANRDGFDAIEACIGPQFCNAVAADNGEPGCEDAPCEAGEQQCNGPQIQRCTDDRTRFEPVGAPCETSGLCNDDGAVAFCNAPLCRRGALSGTEFLCQGATLLRCNDQETGYDPLSTCATAGLCNAGLGFNGCQAPACAPGETRCNGNFVQRCNAERTGFENVEQCQAGTCDSAAGRCADPCVVGSARCNAQGNLEECRNLLVGREITARCGSVQLCDANARTCRVSPQGCTADGVRRCRADGAGSVLEQCSDGRSRFATLDNCDAGEVCDANDLTCDACVQGAEPTCEGNFLVSCSANGKDEQRLECLSGCQTVAGGPDRCRTCVPGSVRCENDQLVVCRDRGTEEVPVRESCESSTICASTVAACNASGAGQGCRCQACTPSDRGCQGTQPVACNDDQSAIVAVGQDCGARGCNPATGACFACAPGDVRCGNDGILEGCQADRTAFADLALPEGQVRCAESNGLDRAQSCDGPVLDNRECPTDICVPGNLGCAECNPNTFQRTCTPTNDGIVQCAGGTIETRPCGGGDDACQVGTCSAGSCNFRSADAGTACPLGATQGKCNGSGTCVACLVARDDCPDDGNLCTTELCSAAGACEHRPISCAEGETCEEGSCVPLGCDSDDDCNDGKACNGVETCNRQSRECQAGAPPACDDGNPCNGVEGCLDTVVGGCTPGTPLLRLSVCQQGGASGVCLDNRCQPACNNQTCQQQSNECATFACDADNACTPTFGTGTCQQGAGTCSGGTCTCNAQACSARGSECSPFACVGNSCQATTAPNSCNNGEGTCSGGNCVCNAQACSARGTECSPFACVGNSCQAVDAPLTCANGTGVCNQGSCDTVAQFPGGGPDDGEGGSGGTPTGTGGDPGAGNTGNTGSGGTPGSGNNGAGNTGNTGSGGNPGSGNDGSGNTGNTGSGAVPGSGNDGSGNTGNTGSGGTPGGTDTGNDGSGNTGNTGSTDIPAGTSGSGNTGTPPGGGPPGGTPPGGGPPDGTPPGGAPTGETTTPPAGEPSTPNTPATVTPPASSDASGAAGASSEPTETTDPTQPTG